MTLKFSSTAGGAGGDFSIEAGRASDNYAGGLFSLSAGRGKTVGGAIKITSGTGDTNTGGMISMLSGQVPLLHQAKYIFELKTLQIQRV